MRKKSVATLLLVVGLALVAVPYLALAGDGSKCAEKASISSTTKPHSCAAELIGGESSKANTDASTTATTADAKGCPHSGTTKTAGADACCDYKGKCADLTLSIKGMTCTGCEQKIQEALKSDKGVIKVISVDYKTGKAVVCYDPEKVEKGKLAELVTKTGYEAEIIPASVTSTSTTTRGATCDITSEKCAGKKVDGKKDNKGDSH